MDCLAKSFKADGVVRGLYPGFLSSVQGIIIYRSDLFLILFILLLNIFLVLVVININILPFFQGDLLRSLRHRQAVRRGQAQHLNQV